MRFGAQDRAAQRLPGKGLRLKVIENDVVGRVFGLADFLDDDAFFARQFFVVEDGVLENVGQNIDGQRDVVFEHARVVGGLLAAGIGVDEAADAFDLFGDGAGRAAAGALEGHVLEHVGDAVGGFGFIARAGIDPNADGGGFQMRHRVGDDSQAVGQFSDGGGQTGVPSG